MNSTVASIEEPSSLVLSWPTVVFFSMSLATVPIYISVILTIYSSRNLGSFKNTFYGLIISLGVADLLAMLHFFLLSSLRTIHAFPLFFWEHRDNYFVAVWGFNQMYYFLCLRSLGAVLLAIQRYLCICRPGSKLNSIVSHLKLYQIFIIHWLPPVIITFPILINTEKTFNTLKDLQVQVAPAQVKLANLIANIFLFVTFVLLAVAYFSILRTVMKTKISRSLRRETRLTLVTVGPLISFLCAFCYYTGQMFFSMAENTQMIYAMRVYFPILTGFMSYINGWVFFLFNADVRRELLKPFRRGITVSTLSETT